ncbi:MAG: hypothetical protein ACE5FY_07090, partial [Nitrospiria bacterium]
IDGFQSILTVNPKTSLSSFLGARVDTGSFFGGPENLTGYINFSRTFGYRSQVNLNFERTLRDKQVTANDLGIGVNYKIRKSLSLKGKSAMSFGSKVQFTEARLRLQYPLTPKHAPYLVAVAKLF